MKPIKTVFVFLLFAVYFTLRCDANVIHQRPEIGKIKAWWTHATIKIFPRTQPTTEFFNWPVSIASARNEYEPFQLIISTEKALENIWLTIDRFNHLKTNQKYEFKTKIHHVAYVDIKQPSDTNGFPGEWPDPLPPYQGGFSIVPFRNYPLWVIIYIPTTCPAGLYTSEVKIEYKGGIVRIPIQLQVWDFQLPEIASLRSGFDLSAKLVAAYHYLDLNSNEFEQLIKKYYQSFAEHRVCPYNPMQLHPIRLQKSTVKMTKQAGLAYNKKFNLEINFRDFKKQAQFYLDSLKFNSFQLSLEGIASSSFFQHGKGQIIGHPQGSQTYNEIFPWYLRQISDFLKQNHWLDKAYIYWFDEPQKKDYQYIRSVNQNIRQMAPGLKTFLTEEPRKELQEQIDIWCLDPRYFNEREVKTARAQGKEVWWYLCTNPKAPYITLFIDAPAIHLRMWLWMTWKYQLDGILVWQTVYWNSETAFPARRKQDPWTDPMSYATGYGLPAGTKMEWGNGDGRFFYPPKPKIKFPPLKNLDDPIPSIRWELLREGLEDYEYFHLFQSKLNQLKTKNTHQKDVAYFESLLKIPKSIIRDLTHFTIDPDVLYTHRQKLAAGIEKMNLLLPD